MATSTIGTRRPVTRRDSDRTLGRGNEHELDVSGLRVVDLFAGVGGLSLGFDLAGFTLVGAFEKWDRAADVYSRNFDHDVHISDLSDVGQAIKDVSRYSPDIIIGGPPCQDFSTAGNRLERSNADLTECFAMIAAASNASIVVMENVPRAKSSNAYHRARAVLRDNEYSVAETVLDASLCGVPQVRKRFFSIGLRNSDAKVVVDRLESQTGLHPMTVAEYMRGEIDTEFYYRHPRNYSRRAVYSVNEPSATIRGVNRPIAPKYPGHHLDAASIQQARPLTTYERGRIQTFPTDWEWFGTKTDVEQMIGNAVPVEMAKFVANGLKATL